MFNLTLHDHLHLTFNEITQRHHAHALRAQSRGRWGRRLRGSEAVLIGCAAIAATGAAFGQGRVFAVAAASMCAIALVVLLISLAFDFDASARAHAASGAHLWGLRERYRSLLSDLHEGALSVSEARLRRDQLIDELRSIYDTTAIIALEDEHIQPVTANEGTIAQQPPVRRSA